ncbi:MAG: alanine--tRNA ligase [Candidatus Magasanikbacteria bacterium]
MTTKQLTKKYLKFFKEHDHAIIDSHSIVSPDDSALFTTAGMQPLVPYLMGKDHPKGDRLADVQKCLRTGDLDEIGDDTHHTFFQMLGNWSLGDYFKREAIQMSYEFLTSDEWLGLDQEKLAISVYAGDGNIPKDTEAAEIWKEQGISGERIAFVGEDNFWSAGETGPCGPSTEMFYWSGEDEAPEEFDPKNETWVEIWNDVFMAYNRKEDGSIEELNQKNVDTGMGLERVVAKLNDKQSAYETDMFMPIISKLEELSGKEYKQSQEVTESMRIVADHIRASVFVLADEEKITPSNKEHGYVLRRLLRRSMNHGKQLGIEKSFLNDLAEIVIDIYGDIYNELKEKKQRVFNEIEKEEEKFSKALDRGYKKFEEVVSDKEQGEEITGQEAFDLYQSFGFPLSMTKEMAEKEGYKVDEQGFEAAKQEHKEKSRQGSDKKFKGGLADQSEMSVKYHTATHLLHAALREVLGDHAKQEGSHINSDRLRFDFAHDSAMTEEEINKVEDLVNAAIENDYEVNIEQMPAEEGREKGAIGLFPEKYKDNATVYSIGDTDAEWKADPDAECFSREFCGGPHVDSTGELDGEFKIIKEKSNGAGIRRVKAVLE